MRFAALHLRAYGHFSGRVLELPRSAGTDLHLIVGANEAGKSTLLAAVADFLFGFPHRTERSFLHEPTQQRVGASLETPEGTRMYLMRRRGRTSTLRPFHPESGEEDTANPQDAALQALLSGGLDRKAYGHLFGLDLASLTEGGEALLQGEGEVGQALFQAAAGVAALRRLQARLKQETEGIFRPHANAINPLLNQALARHRGAVDAVRQATVRTAEWVEAEQTLTAAETAHEAAQAERARLNNRRLLLARLRATLPRLAEHRHLQEALAQLAQVPALAPDAGEQRRQAEADLLTVGQGISGGEARLGQLQHDRAALQLNPALLAREATVSRLFQRIPGYASAQAGLNEQEALRAQAATRAHTQRTLLGLGTDQPEALRAWLPVAALRERVIALAQTGPTLQERAGTRQARRATLEAQHDAATNELAGLPPTEGLPALNALLHALATLAAAGTALDAASAEHGQRASTAAEAAAALGFGDPEALARLATPAHTAVEGLMERFAEHARARQQWQERSEELDDRNAQAEGGLAAEAADGDLLTEAALRAARAGRDEGLRLLCAGWLDADEAARRQAADWAGAPGPTVVASALTRAVAQADRIADALRADAGRAARQARWLDEIASIRAEKEGLEGQRRVLEADAAATFAEWHALLAPLGVAAARPRDLLEWLAGRQQFLHRHEQTGLAQQRLAQARAEHQRLLAVLDDALARFDLAPRAVDEPPPSALARLQALQETLQSLANRRTVLEAQMEAGRTELQQLAPQCAEAAEAWARWELDWADAVGALGLPARSLAVEAQARLQAIGELEAALQELEIHTAQSDQHRAVIAAFEGDASALGEALGEGAIVDGAQAVARVEAWHAALQDAAQARDTAQRLDDGIAGLRGELKRSHDRLGAVAETLAGLCREAGVTDAADLPAIEERARERREAKLSLEQLEASLREQFGRDIESLAAEAGAEGLALDEVEAELGTILGGIAGAEAVERCAHEHLFAARQRLEAIDGSAKAALAVQEQAVTAAEIDTLAHRWARLRLAGALLGRVVEAWRARHQGPLLERASAIFARITLNSFEGLTTDYEDDQQRLLGVRPGGERVDVEGMSQGTRDQLYLALRLATIESHLASRGAFPVIADDLLVQFDDERALATLAVLLELAGRTQVLLFTHHRHLVDLAERAGLAGRMDIRHL